MNNESMIIDEPNINAIKNFKEVDGEINDNETSLRFIKWGV